MSETNKPGKLAGHIIAAGIIFIWLLAIAAVIALLLRFISWAIVG